MRVAIAGLAMICSLPALAAHEPTHGAGLGPVTKLPLPRFALLKTDNVNLRGGPGRDYEIKWIYKRPGLPVEITAEFETWRRVRDASGDEGWILAGLITGKRTVLSAPWSHEPIPLHARPDAASDTVALMEPGVQASVLVCKTGWCRIRGTGLDGYVASTTLWGVYPDEDLP
ncbi:SH3 domain-containing protein [Alsobacter sp. R-9]